jgi:deoxyribonuclease-1
MLISSTRALALVTTAGLVLLAAACGDTDPIAPGLGFAESGEFRGGLEAEATTSSPAFVANRSGRVFLRACGPSDANFDFLVTSGRATDTVVVGNATTTGCESIEVPVVAGRTYRVRGQAVTGRGAYVICWSYAADACASLQATAPAVADVPAGYYAGLEGRSGTALFTALHDALRTGHRGFQYDSARGYLYQDVEDPDDNNLIEDMYAGRVVTVDRRAGSNTDAGDASLNAEHSWPQSCGAREDRTNGPRGDLHVIFATDAAANQRRGNDPYGMVTTASQTFGPDSAGNFSRYGTDGTRQVFEPRAERRGDIARAIFYFYVRYVPEIPASISLANFAIEQATLRQWAQQDPPDAFERARNNEAYAVQGNRNPFVDRPELLATLGEFPTTVAGTAPTCSF